MLQELFYWDLKILEVKESKIITLEIINLKHVWLCQKKHG
jgi:hypothetical protein